MRAPQQEGADAGQFSNKRGLLSLGICVRGPDHRTSRSLGEWAAAREFRLPFTSHIASHRATAAMGGISILHAKVC